MVTGALLTYVDSNGAIPEGLMQTAALMSDICSELMIVTNNTRAVLPKVDAGLRVISGYAGMEWPLGGLYAALSLSRQPYVWVVDARGRFFSLRLARSMVEEIALQRGKVILHLTDGEPGLHHSLFRKDCHDVLYQLAGDGQPDWRTFRKAITEGVWEPSA